MADITWVYYLHAKQSNRVKVGVTGNVKSRMSTYKTHWPDDLELLGTVRCGSRDAALELEGKFLAYSGEDRLHGEWVVGSEYVMRLVKQSVINFQDWDTVAISEADILKIEGRMSKDLLDSAMDRLCLTDPYARVVMKNSRFR